ncbi:F-box protein [Forsythia ovata]|uniref:F-box protein n=1 Tax=Forsythia ovata TaxID=205694 RepID=A0ABD1UDU4_9LAMI
MFRSRSRCGCQITDHGLYHLSMAKCICNLSSVSIWGSTVITDKGVVKMISRATSLQHLNIGGTFITDMSLFAIADSCPYLKTIVFQGCPHITENGLVALVKICCKLESINVWGMKVPLDCFIGLLTINPALQIQPKGMLVNDQRVPMWPVF